MSIVDDWGPGEDDQDPLHLDHLSMARLSQLNFLFGGVGDGKVLYPSQCEYVLKKARSPPRLWLNHRCQPRFPKAH